MGKQIGGAFIKFPETAKIANAVKDKGVSELIHQWKEGMKKKGYPARWGDEVEYMILKFDDTNERVEVTLEQTTILKGLEEMVDAAMEKGRPVSQQDPGVTAGYTPEFAAYMVESEPNSPYGSSVSDLLKVETNMFQRRKAIKAHADTGSWPFTLSMFPGLKADYNSKDPSELEIDEPLASQEVRFKAADSNIRSRRNDEGVAKVPLFVDINTLSSKGSFPSYIDTDTKSVLLQDESILFGPGHCGFQITFGAADEDDARRLHDQLIPLGPVMLTLTASTPIYRGFLVDTDVRWKQIQYFVDDRTKTEREQEAKTDYDAVTGPRWSTNNTYIANDPRLHPEHQKSQLQVNEQVQRRLEEEGMDSILAKHFAHDFLRDPIVMSEEDIKEHSTKDEEPALPNESHDASVGTDHIDAIEGTLYPHVRFKVPPANDPRIGYRVEFRPMETQFTDFENAALSIFLRLLTLALRKSDKDMYVPLRVVYDNMEKAHPRDAVRSSKFLWRVDTKEHSGENGAEQRNGDSGEADVVPMKIDEIFNGSSRHRGLLDLVYEYMESEGYTSTQRQQLEPYLDLVRGRSDGTLATAARWMREYAQGHEQYRKDSYVNAKICYDIMSEVRSMMNGERENGMFKRCIA
ncbi:GCS-domain-containing protein [Patellaria atrata CBS 101060]|uniref:Glutamate--cysteine ligase n=1 Tax=Patellaria atrata CBS 101060 TaxID=1346257 RepID=A0A9P4VMC3_9PEZI|nr:GCS-domain-containing protein [Patellaria atrata CBS 101060]